MDLTEDLSARVVLQNILSTEPVKTPVTRSKSTVPSGSPTRRSSRLSHRNPDPSTLQSVLRRSLKNKVLESITKKSVPATGRRSRSVVLRETNTPGPTSVLFDDDITPRNILRNFLQTEPVKTPVIHVKAASEEPQPPSASSSFTSRRPSTELTDIDLPDITIGGAESIAKRLNRKRPHRSLNVTAFEKHLKNGDDVEEDSEKSMDDHSLSSLSSSASLSLKTPFVDNRTERNALRRRVSQRQKITADTFAAAVNKRQMGEVGSFVDQGLCDTALSEGFTLGLSKLDEPDSMTNIVHCNTALYAQPNAMTSNFSFVATQDKPTMMASQLQRQIIEVEPEGLREAKDTSVRLIPAEEEVVAETQIENKSFALSPLEEDVDAAESQEEEEKSTADDQHKDAAAMSESDEEEGPAESQMSVEEAEEEGDRMQAQTEVEADSQGEEEEDGAVASQTEDDDAVDSQHEDEAAASSQSEEEEMIPDTQSEAEEGANAADSQFEEVENIADSAEDGLADSQPEEEPDGELEEEEDEEDKGEKEEEEDEEEEEKASEELEHDLDHISRRSHRSEGGVRPVTELTVDLEGADVDPDANKENSFHLSVEESGHLDAVAPPEAAGQDMDEQEEESEEEEDDEENEEVPSKTPAFVKEKRRIFQSAFPSAVLKDAQASTSEGLPPTKPKRVRKPVTKQAKQEGVLPKRYLMGIFKHFAKTKVSPDVYPALAEIMDKFFERLADDLETYAGHAKRKTIEVEDAKLLLRRQGHVNDKVLVEGLIEKYLRMDQRRLLIPIATGRNAVSPKKRR